jgi:UPF0755 protein
MLGITLLALIVAGSGYIVLREVQASMITIDDDAASTNAVEPVEIEVEPGDTTSQIATKLRAAGLIRQPLFFVSLVRLEGLDGKLQAGRYLLDPSMSMSEILIALQHSRVGEVEVTIREGLRIEEVAGVLAQTGVIDAADFVEAASNGRAFQDTHFLLKDLPAGASLEGYLFPDTYRIAATASVTEVIEMMLDNFDQKYGSIERDVRVPNADVHDVVTMASIVQREAARAEEMPLIAAVFWNRLEEENAGETGNRLQADATVQYALGYSEEEQTWWRKNLTLTELEVESPYNTRVNAGLPPGPISNPGMAALTAAAQPDESAEYLYFVADCALDGSHNFATTFEEFQQYEAEFLACQ